jgi:hypothetical protein
VPQFVEFIELDLQCLGLGVDLNGWISASETRRLHVQGKAMRSGLSGKGNTIYTNIHLNFK